MAADLADLGPSANRDNAANTGPANDEGPREGHRFGLLAHGKGFSGQQRFINLELRGRAQLDISSDPVSLFQYEHVAHHHLAPRNASSFTIADDQRAGTRQVSQGRQHPLAARFLNDRNRDGKCGKEQQDRSFQPVSEQQIDKARRQQQGKHGFPQDLADYSGKRALVAMGYFIGAIARLALPDLLIAEPCSPVIDRCRSYIHPWFPGKAQSCFISICWFPDYPLQGRTGIRKHPDIRRDGRVGTTLRIIHDCGRERYELTADHHANWLALVGTTHHLTVRKRQCCF